MHKLKRFQYSITLDLNIVYYTIEILPECRNIITIVTEFGKFRYNRFPVVLWYSSEIFQAKVYYLIGEIEGGGGYIDDILVIRKLSPSQHIDYLIVVFASLSAAGMKFNDPKCSFGFNYIPFLGYIITQGVIRTDPNKLTGIIYL